MKTLLKIWPILLGFLSVVLVGIFVRLSVPHTSAPKEVPSLRNFTSKTVEAADGTMTTTFYGTPIHYKTETGEYKDIDTTVIPSKKEGYAYQNETNFAKSYFKQKSDGFFMRLEFENIALEYGIADIPELGGAPKAVEVKIEENEVVYPEIFDGVDLVFVPDVGQYSLRVRVKDKETAKKITSVPLRVKVTNGEFEEIEDKIMIRTGSGFSASFSKPFLVDAQNIYADSELTEPGVEYALQKDTDESRITKTLTGAGKKWMLDEKRIYPVVIDPITIFFPDENSGSTTVDGNVYRAGVDEPWSNLVGGVGVNAVTNTAFRNIAGMKSAATTNQYDENTIGLFTFNTSTIGAGRKVVAATFSLYGYDIRTASGDTTVELCNATLASNNNIVTADYASNLGDYKTQLAEGKLISTLSTTGYNTWTLNTAGLNNINTTGISQFQTVLEWARTGVFTGTWNPAGTYTRFTSYLAEQTGIEQDPRLTVSWRYEATAHLKMDEGTGLTTGDSSYLGTHTGTLGVGSSAPSWQTEDMCVQGKCMLFDGSLDTIAVAAESTINLQSKAGYSVCGWIKPLSDGEGDLGEFWSKGTSYLRVEQESAGSVKVKALFDLATADAAYTTTRTISTSEWTHVCATYADDGDDEITVYLNGKAEGTSSAVGNGSPADDSAQAGALGGDTSNNFNGYIDEFKIFPTELTAAQIKTEALPNASSSGSGATLGGKIDQGDFLSKGLVGYWKLDEASGNAVDSSGKSTTLTDTNTVAFVGGKFANAGDFESGNSEYQYAADNASLSLTGDVTISAWIKPESVTAATLFDIAGKWDGANESYLLTQYGDEIRYYIESSSNYATTDSTNLAVGTWYHVTASYQASSATVRIFVNGTVQAATISGTIPTSLDDDTGRFHIGAEDSTTTAANFYDGVIDDVRVYNWAFGGREALLLSEWVAGPILYYKFDENTGTSAYDSSGNGNTGTITSGTWSPGKVGPGLTFDGTNTLVNAGDVNSLDIADGVNLTVEFWMNRSAYTTDDIVVAKKPGYLASTIGWMVWIDDSTDDVNFVISNGTGDRQNVDSTTTFTSAGWNHVAVVYDDSSSTGSKIYINGVDDNATNTTTGTFTNIASLATSTYALRIGISSNGIDPFIGSIDDVRIYNYARTAKQIVQDMNAGHPSVGTPVGSAVGYWRFDDADGTNANDATESNNDLTLSAESWTNTGKFGTAFNGTNATWASKTDDPDFDFAAADSMSVSLWVRSDATANPGANEYLVSKGALASAGYALYFNSSGQPVYAIDDDATWTASPDFTATYSTDVYDNTWHHIVGVKDGTNNIKIYVDGTLRATSASISAEGTLANAGSLVFGDSDAVNNGDEFTGDIDEAKIYRFALSSEEVKLEYNRGKAIVLGSQSTTSGTSVPDNSYDREYCVPGDSSTCNPPIAHWKMDENADNTCTGGTADVCDVTQNANDGTKTSAAATTWGPGKFGGGLHFDGTANEVTINDTPFDFERTDDFTFEAWVKTKKTNGSIILKKDDGSQTGYFLFYNDTTGEVRIWIQSTSTNRIMITGTTKINDEVWHRVAVTYDGSSTAAGTKIYVDSILNTNTVGSDNLTTSILNNNNLKIGCAETCVTSDAWDGELDDIRIYDYVRTPAQIAWSYNRGRPVAHYKLDECTGTVANDSSGNSLTGTITIGASGTNTSVGTCSGAAGEAWFDGATGKYNASLEFDDTDDYVTASDNAKLDLTSNITLSAWVKTAANEADNVIVSKGTSYEMGIIANGSVYWDGVGAQADDASARVLSGTWHHIVITNNDTTATYYVDGVLTGTDAAGIDADNATALYIGYDGTNFFDGQIDDVRIYNYPLTTVQIKTLYNENSAVRFAPASGLP